MKKNLVLMVSILMLMLVLVLVASVGCTLQSDKLPKVAATLEGKVVNLGDGHFLLASETIGLISVSATSQIYNVDNQKVDILALKSGQRVEIGFSGMIMESYPAQLGEIDYIKILSQEDDLVGLYGAIIADVLKSEGLLEVDDAYVVLDLSQILVLTNVEKEALVNFAPTPFGVMGVLGTLQEYEGGGYGERGVFLSFNIEKETDGDIKFSIVGQRQKETFSFENGLAEKLNGAWRYRMDAIVR